GPGTRRSPARQRAGESGRPPGRSGALLEVLGARRLPLRCRLVQLLGAVLPGDRRRRSTIRAAPGPERAGRARRPPRRRCPPPLLRAAHRLHPSGVERVDRGPGWSRRYSPASRRGPRAWPPAFDRRLRVARNRRLPEEPGADRRPPREPRVTRESPADARRSGASSGSPAARAQVSRPASVTCAVSDKWSAKILNERGGSVTPVAPA